MRAIGAYSMGTTATTPGEHRFDNEGKMKAESLWRTLAYNDFGPLKHSTVSVAIAFQKVIVVTTRSARRVQNESNTRTAQLEHP